MKKIVYTSIASLLIVVMFALTAFAAPYNPYDFTSVNEYSALLPPGVKQSKGSSSLLTRGNFLMRADLVVKNNSHGRVGAFAIAYTSVPVDFGYITIYLDRYIEEENRWAQVNYYEAEFKQEDYPDGLKTPTVDISFINQPKGKYYRLRGAFAVSYQGVTENISARTDGILLD